MTPKGTLVPASFRSTDATQLFRLGSIALNLRTFTVSELKSLTGIPENTIYGFLSGLQALDRDLLSIEELPAKGPGRPRKRYSLTPGGVDYLLERNTGLAASMKETPIRSKLKDLDAYLTYLFRLLG